mmetsp:Transcript_30565/g.77195  ORF Transcript_30565/g.77195 Transcript_30565/m.77195 type:complete len:238 (-) Transcript_30565:1232-1945(-)
MLLDAHHHVLAPQRATLRCPAGPQQGRDVQEARRGPGQDMAPELRRPAAAPGPFGLQPPGERSAVRRHPSGRPAQRRVPRAHRRPRPALLERPDRSLHRQRQERPGGCARQLAARPVQVHRGHVGEGRARVEYPDGRSSRVRARQELEVRQEVLPHGPRRGREEGCGCREPGQGREGSPGDDLPVGHQQLAVRRGARPRLRHLARGAPHCLQRHARMPLLLRLPIFDPLREPGAREG